MFWGEGDPVSVDGGQTSYLYYVNDPGNVVFQVTVIYSNSFINDNLPRLSELSVEVPESQ